MVKRSVAVLLLLCIVLVGCGQEAEESWIKVGNPTEKEDSAIHEATPDDIGNNGGSKPETPETKEPITPEETMTEDSGRTYVVALDPGHGGGYSGATNGDLVEKELNLKLSFLIKDYLESHYSNVTVYMTRTDDQVPSKDLVEDLDLRVKNAKQAGADVYLSIHFNASEDHNSHGSQICVSRAKNITDGCYQLADCILAELEPLGFKNRGPYQRDSNDTKDSEGNPVDYYAINRHGAENDLVAVIVENCYMDNNTDVLLFDTDEEMQAIAKADAVGVMNYLTQYVE